IPGLGIKGIALSAVVGSTMGSTIALWRLHCSPLKESLRHIWPPAFAAMSRVINVGIPSAFQRLSWAGAVFVLFFILSHCLHPTEALASWTIGMRVEGLVFMPLMALSLAVSSIVGQSLGARQVDRAFTAGWHVACIGVAVRIVPRILIFVFPAPFPRLRSRDRQTISYTAAYSRVTARAEPCLAVGMVLW